MRQSEESVKVSPQHPYLRNSPSLMGIWPVLFSAVSTDLKALKLSSDPVFQKTRIDYQLFSANSHKRSIIKDVKQCFSAIWESVESKEQTAEIWWSSARRGGGGGQRAKKAEIIISVKTVLEARAKNGRFWAGRQAGWGGWRFMKRWKFEKSSFFIQGTKGLRAGGPKRALPSSCHNPD